MIDDYFAVSKESLKVDANDALSVKCLDRADEIYERRSLAPLTRLYGARKLSRSLVQRSMLINRHVMQELWLWVHQP